MWTTLILMCNCIRSLLRVTFPGFSTEYPLNISVPFTLYFSTDLQEDKIDPRCNPLDMFVFQSHQDWMGHTGTPQCRQHHTVVLENGIMYQ